MDICKTDSNELSFNYLIHSHLSPSSRGSLVPFHFLPLEWYHLHIWGCWYFSQQSWFQLVIHPASILHDVVVAKWCPTLCDPTMDCSMAGFPVLHQLPEIAQTPVHWVSDAIQPSHPLPSPSPPAFNHFQHQGLFQGVSSLHQVAKVLELQLQHQSFQWIFRIDFL